jgi:Domain of unknown function (DUF4411)
MLQAQRAYPMEVFPNVWEQLEKLVEVGRLLSSDEVLREFEKKEQDVVYAWAVKHQEMFVAPVESIQREVTKIMGEFPKLVDERTGKSFADPWVVATALHAGECAVVTEETQSGPDRPKIPTVCAVRQLQCMRLIEMIRKEAWVFRG